jgi:hypothetical protein
MRKGLRAAARERRLAIIVRRHDRINDRLN